MAATPAPAAALSPVEIVKAFLGSREPDTFKNAKVRRYQPDTGALEDDRWVDDVGPFRVLAWFAALGLLVAIGLSVFVCINGTPTGGAP